MKKKILFIFILMAALLVIGGVSNAAEEKIYNYDENIYIHEDGSMDVEEIITVYAAGNQIQRGIYRDFPTRYKDRYGNNVKIKFDVTEVLRDDETEPYHTEKKGNGIRLYVGDSNKTLNQGMYTYTIKYETDRQLGFYEDYDEIYWNAIGNGWNFKIEGGTTTVYFPKKVDIIKKRIIAYTGAYGETGESNSYDYYYDKKENSVSFRLNKSLDVGEGFTIAVGFEKGGIEEPDFAKKLGWFISDNVGGLIALVFFIGLVIWQYYTWRKYGKDPKKDLIIPLYYPPEGFEPEDVKYVDSMGSTAKCFEATLMNMAIKGYFRFEKNGKVVDIVKTDKKDLSDLTGFEKKIYDKFNNHTELKYSSSLQIKLASLQSTQRETMKKKHQGKMFNLNMSCFGISVCISIIMLTLSSIIGGLFGEDMEDVLTGFFAVGVIGGFAFSFWMFIKAIIKMIFKRSWKKVLVVLTIPFVLFDLMVTIALVQDVFSVASFSYLFVIIANIIYFFLIRTYTVEGRKIKDQIEGFKLFIKTVEGDEIVEKTPELFDKYFPYAYVLGLENKWADKFEDILKAANYTPYWCDSVFYAGGYFNASSFTSDFSSSMSSGISSASTAPGSSSGSGGGGFSGGGGGRRPEAAAGKIRNKKQLSKSKVVFLTL